MRALALPCLLSLVPIAAHAERLQVTVVLGEAFDHERGGADFQSVSAFEKALHTVRPDAELYLIACDEVGLPTRVGPTSGLTFLVRAKNCGNTDGVEHALATFAQEPGPLQRIVVFAPLGRALATGRATAEMIGRTAEHQRVAIHVVETRPYEEEEHWRRDELTDDVADFLDDPTAPGVRVRTPRPAGDAALRRAVSPAPARHRPRGHQAREQAARQGHRTGTTARSPRAPQARDRRRALRPGPGARLRLAAPRDPSRRARRSRRRPPPPSEIAAHELPAALAGVSLEPLLDVVFDFVDARRVLEATIPARKSEDGLDAAALGASVARAVLEPRRLRPSRR